MLARLPVQVGMRFGIRSSKKSRRSLETKPRTCARSHCGEKRFSAAGLFEERFDCLHLVGREPAVWVLHSLPKKFHRSLETANVFYPGRSQCGGKRFFVAAGLFEERFGCLHLVGRY